MLNLLLKILDEIQNLQYILYKSIKFEPLNPLESLLNSRKLCVVSFPTIF